MRRACHLGRTSAPLGVGLPPTPMFADFSGFSRLSTRLQLDSAEFFVLLRFDRASEHEEVGGPHQG
jgi:class 3 adenylate cyclase